MLGTATVVETHRRWDGSWEVIWEDSRGAEHLTIEKDPLGYRIGFSITTLLKQ